MYFTSCAFYIILLMFQENFVFALLTQCKYYAALSHGVHNDYIFFFKHISVDSGGKNCLAYHLIHFVTISIQPKILQGKYISVQYILKNHIIYQIDILFSWLYFFQRLSYPSHIWTNCFLGLLHAVTLGGPLFQPTTSMLLCYVILLYCYNYFRKLNNMV